MGGSKRDWFMICVMFCAWSWPFVEGSESHSRASLDSFLYDYAFKKLYRPRTGKLYDVSLPAIFSGMEVSVVRMRASGLWRNGANHSPFAIPPLVLPFPFAKRVDIMYQNLGNWSSSYYSVPDYTFVAPVVGFLAYDPNRSSPSYGLIELHLMGDDPFVVKFPNVDGNVAARCVRFDTNGTLELSNVTVKSSCVVRRQGHFSVVIPHQPKGEKTKWWVMGIGAGVVILVVLIVIGIFTYKWIKGKMIKKMERQSERSEGLDTIWIGRSRMPSASGIRTQPTIEDSYVP